MIPIQSVSDTYTSMKFGLSLSKISSNFNEATHSHCSLCRNDDFVLSTHVQREDNNSNQKKYMHNEYNQWIHSPVQHATEERVHLDNTIGQGLAAIKRVSVLAGNKVFQGSHYPAYIWIHISPQ